MLSIVVALILAGVGVFVFLSLSQSYTYYIDTTQEFASSGSIYHGEGILVTNGEGEKFEGPEDGAAIRWGNVTAPSVTTDNVTVTNLMVNPIELSYAAFGWSPENATDYMAVSWDYDNKTIAPMDSLVVNFTLTVYSNATAMEPKDFSFNIMLTGTESGVKA